jgi:hypothetical protein
MILGEVNATGKNAEKRIVKSWTGGRPGPILSRRYQEILRS